MKSCQGGGSGISQQQRRMPELQQILLEHRRALLEKLIQLFPDVLKTHRSVVDLWRLRLKAPLLIRGAA